MKELSDGQRALLTVALTILILFFWQKIYKFPQPPQHPPAPAQGSSVPTAVPKPTPPVTVATPVTAEQATEDKTIAVESPLYRVELSNRGAVVRSWKLKKYLDDQKPPRPLELVNSTTAQQLGAWPFSVILQNPDLEAQANSALFLASSTQTVLQAPAEVTFRWSDGHLSLTKRLKFADAYQMGLEISATLDGNPIPVAVAWRGGFGDTSVFQAAQMVMVFYHAAGKLTLLPYNKVGVSGHPDQRWLRPGTMEAEGIEDQFFTAAFLPNGPGLALWDWASQRQTTSEGKTVQEPVAEMAAGSSTQGPLSLRIYVGPKDVKFLGQLQPPLEDLVQFGWTGIIAKPLLFILQWTFRYVPNYGWCIVLLTIAINTALFPLKMSSWRSMQKMQRVAPELRSIQDRYKKYGFNDPRKRKMNEEMMAIYQREGINPMGSCIPMLMQLPIWWALWRVLNGAIELRHAPWFGWVHDLSARDPYYILPILMTITMYFSTKMTPTTTVDPAQQKMMTYMPLIFAVIFFRLSSGLNLYMFTSNLLAMGQQWYLNRAQPLPAKGKNKKKT